MAATRAGLCTPPGLMCASKSRMIGMIWSNGQLEDEK
jgi:hypothetical protein